MDSFLCDLNGEPAILVHYVALIGNHGIVGITHWSWCCGLLIMQSRLSLLLSMTYQLQGCHSHKISKFPDFSLTFHWLIIIFPWPIKHTKIMIFVSKYDYISLKWVCACLYLFQIENIGESNKFESEVLKSMMWAPKARAENFWIC